MTGRGILVVGASGFLGRHVVDALQARRDRPTVIPVVHRTPLRPPSRAYARVVYADLADVSSLARCMVGVGTVIHTAAYLGDDEQTCTLVNGRGTEGLIDAARGAGVDRIFYVSNAAVYGNAIGRGAREDDAVVAPVTPISRSRVRAERAVLAASGIVLRPLFVYGDGDTRFIPTIIRSVVRRRFLIDHGRARLSVISASDAGTAIAALACAAPGELTRGVYHLTDQQPVTFREIVQSVAWCVGVRVPRLSLPLALARWLVSRQPDAVVGDSSASAVHRLFLVARDHYYDATKLWTQLSFGPGPSLLEQMPRYRDWYASCTAPV